MGEGIEDRAVDDVGRRREAAAADGERADLEVVQRIAEGDQADAEIAGVAVRMLARRELDRHVPRAAESQRDGAVGGSGPGDEGRANLIVGVGALNRRGPEGLAVHVDRLTAVHLLPAKPPRQGERLFDPGSRPRPPPPRSPGRFRQHAARGDAGDGTRARLNSASPRDASHRAARPTAHDGGAAESRQRSIPPTAAPTGTPRTRSTGAKAVGGGLRHRTTSSPRANRGAPGIRQVGAVGESAAALEDGEDRLGAAGEVLDHRDARARANDAPGGALDDAVEDTAAHDAGRRSPPARRRCDTAPWRPTQKRRRRRGPRQRKGSGACRESYKVAAVSVLTGRAAVCATGRRVATAAVPADQVTPPALEYIARSTTSWAGVAPRLSTMMPKRRPVDDGNVRRSMTLVRLFGQQVHRRLRRRAVLEVERHPRRPGGRRRVGDQDVGLQAVRAAHFSVGQRPARAGRGRARRVVRLVPAVGVAGHHIARSTMIGTPLVDARASTPPRWRAALAGASGTAPHRPRS